MRAEQESREAYLVNERSANWHMSFAALFTGILLFLVYFGYLFKLFTVGESTYRMTIIVIPITVFFLITPMFYIKSKFLANPKYKYFLLSLFVLAIGVLNVIMPKHAVLGWAVCIALTAHYYSPKVCRVIFVAVLIEMFIALSLATFYGEFDANLFSGELDKETQLIYNRLLPNPYPDTAQGRWQYLVDLGRAGENRFINIFANYYLGRALFVTLLFLAMYFLNRRTNDLMESEISVNGEYQKSKTELEVAKDIQMNTLPSETISSKDVEIVAELRAAKEVGGDLYDYVDIDDDHVAILIGDVSGKGVPAAMFMMKTITSFRDAATSGKTPSEILRDINTSIFKGNKSSMFVTAFLAILNKRDGTLQFANAGHNPPIVGLTQDFHYLTCNSGFLLGCFKDVFVRDETIVLKPGESITLYTDGVTEARNAAGDFYGEKRFLETMNRRPYGSVVELHRAIKDDVNTFVAGAPQSDDITYLTLKYHGGSYSYKEQSFPATKESILQILGMINDFGEEHHFPDDFKNKLVIVGDELVSNIINYGYAESDGTGDVFLRLLFNEDENEFVLTVIDHGKPFNQLDVDNPDVGTEQSLAHVGGLGIHIVKSIMTECAYDRINGKNMLVLKKRF